MKGSKMLNFDENRDRLSKWFSALKSVMITLITCFIFIPTLLAQDPEASFENELLNQLDQLRIVQLSNSPVTNNALQLYQRGNSNIADIDQVNTASGVLNQAILIQNGNINESNIDMIGEGNELEAVQAGNRNQFNLNVDGNFIQNQVLQLGNNNEIYQDLNVDDRSYTIIQEGNNNYIDQQEWDPLSTGIKIHQMGSGMDLIIRNSTIIP